MSDETPTRCIWVPCDDPDMSWWDTACDNAHTFIDGGPIENSYKFCPYCGNELAIEQEDNNP